MKSYNYPSLFFKKKWCWFADPYDELNIDMINFFSYNKVDISGFKRKEGLTVVIDLSRNIDDIWANTRKSFIRKQVEKGGRNGIKIKNDNNFKQFKKIYLNFRKGKNLAKDSYKVFVDNGVLFSAYYKNKMVAGGIFISDVNYMRAWVLASSRLKSDDGKMREIVGQANRMIIWEAIKYAKDKGLKWLDLGGINPNSENKNEKTLAEFKESFGGERKSQFYYSKVNSKLLNSLIKFKSIFKI